MKKFGIAAGEIILACALLYLMGAFINASFNIAFWEAGWRVIIGVMSLISSMIVIFGSKIV